MSMTVEAARKELSEVEAKLQDLAGLQKRRDLLRQFVILGEQLSCSNSTQTTAVLDSPESPPELQPSEERSDDIKNLRTSEAAYRVLKNHGKLHMKNLLKEARRIGWVGSGDDDIDETRLYVSMHRLPKRFKSHGAGYWSAKEEVKTAG